MAFLELFHDRLAVGYAEPEIIAYEQGGWPNDTNPTLVINMQQ